MPTVLIRGLRQEWRFLLALAAVIGLIYLPGLDNPPAFDDTVGVLYNPNVLEPKRLIEAFLNPAYEVPLGAPMPNYAYRPLTEASFALNLHLFPRMAHPLRIARAGNLLIHLMAALLVFALARRLATTAAPAFARWAALWFAAHPMAVHAVGYVYQRSVSLGAMLSFLTLLLYWQARESQASWRSWSYYFALLTGLLDMGTKETAVTLPLLIGALEWILRKPNEPRSAVFKRWLPFALLPMVIVIQILRLKARHFHETGKPLFTRTESGYEPLDYLLVELPILLGYLRLNALPFPMCFYFDRTTPSPDSPPEIPVLTTCLCAAILLVLAGWVFFGPARHRLARLGTALFFAPLMLESTVFPIHDAAWMHRCYPSLLGAGLLFALAMGRPGRVNILLGAATLMLLAGLSLRETYAWSSTKFLLARDVRHAFHDGAVWGCYAGTRLECKDPAGAEPLYRRAVASPWQTAKDRTGHALALMALGRHAEAMKDMDQALADFPDDPTPIWLAVRHLKEGDSQRSEFLARRTERLPVVHPELALWAAQRRISQNLPDAAERVLLRNLRYYPTYPQLWESLGQALVAQEKWREAETAFRKAISLDPRLAQAHCNLGGVLYQQGNLEGARAEFREALRLQADYPLAKQNLERLTP